MSEPVLRAIDLRKSYEQGGASLEILRGASFEVAAGERLAILGRSGSGKSTLLHLLAGLDDPASGEVWVGSDNLSAASSARRAAIRSERMGFVYQAHHLLPEFSAQENVSMPLRLAGAGAAEAMAGAAAMLQRVGLDARLTHRPARLSGGERQRVAVARALVGTPSVVLADEPTGNLDQENAEGVFALLRELSDELGSAVVVVTHDQAMLRHVHRSLTLEEGRLVPA
ncbi:MAG: ABC transporter ATP-binding protein [Pseudomonadota bacterium]